MRKQYSYSNDREFLSKIDLLQIKEQWAKVTLLEYNSEIPLKDIEGKVTTGNLSKNGNSTVRRTCNLTCAIDTFKYNIDDIKADYSISKKIYLELGITNTTNEYLEEKIIWFPQGVFFITGASITASTAGTASVNLQFKDKMAQLDGTIGGILPATVRFDTVTTIINNTAITKKTLVYDIIMEAVNHFGNEDLTNIIIDDVPFKAKRIVKWMGQEPVWIYPIQDPSTHKISYDICFDSDIDEKRSAYKGIVVDSNQIPIAARKYKTNQDIGYMYESFVYDNELTFKAGSKVTDVLDKIKKWLGNYEYFYDEYGQFHFQEIKNYLNNSQSAEIWEKIIETGDTDYLYEPGYGKSVYTFSDNVNLISITNTPNYDNIKNDFVVEGTVTKNNIKQTCRYHLVIDDKPTISTDGYDNLLIYTDPLSNNTIIDHPEIVAPKRVNNKWTWNLPDIGTSGKIYGLLDQPITLTFKKKLTTANEFSSEYQILRNEENTLINNEDNIFSTLPTDVKDDLFEILENYMGYNDNSEDKEKYRDIIFTIARQLNRYGVIKTTTPRSSSKAYYQYLSEWYDKMVAANASSEQISWCSSLLYLLFNLFKNSSSSNISNITTSTCPINSDYDWPAINTIIPQLWSDVSSSLTGDAIRVARKNSCLTAVNKLIIKRKQLQILIEQHSQVMNEYSSKISIANKNGVSTNISTWTTIKNKLNNQIKNYKSQLNSCEERLHLLYAALTFLGTTKWIVEETYYTIDVNINTRTTSFWYYVSDKSESNYGWNEIKWYKYYHEYTEPTAYYPDGLGSMTYIDFNSIELDYTTLDNTNYPSMNRYSTWYNNYYKNYARIYELPFFDDEDYDSYHCNNWRTELILQGMRAEDNGTDPGYYYQELKANWPTIYDYKTNQLLIGSINYIDYFIGNTGVILGTDGVYNFVDTDFNTNDTANATFRSLEMQVKNYSLNYDNNNYLYFFDMIDSSSPTWGEYCVNNIGRRTNVNVSDSVNCIFSAKIPDYAFINISNITRQERNELYSELSDIAEDIIQITDIYYKNFATGGYAQSAYDQIRYDLQQHTSYQNNVSLNAIPCLYLEPNTRVTIDDDSTGTYGDYMVQSVSMPLGVEGRMSVNLSKAMERI